MNIFCLGYVRKYLKFRENGWKMNKLLNDFWFVVIGGKLEKKKFESCVDWNVVDVMMYFGWFW